jgi:pimeloyl-ACP methyl ester carboxylesterase
MASGLHNRRAVTVLALILTLLSPALSNTRCKVVPTDETNNRARSAGRLPSTSRYGTPPSLRSCHSKETSANAGRTHKVIVADSRGHGQSTRSKHPIGYEVMTDDYVALLNHLEVKKVALVGHSDGAIIGLNMAMRYPERLSKLFAFGANYNVAGFRADGPDDKDPVWGPIFAKLRKDYESQSPTPSEYDLFSKEMNELWASQPDYKPEQLARIKTPTVIADGEHDEFIKLDHTKELARLVPGSELLILPDVGHLAMWQNAELFNSELMRFLNTTPK